MAKVLLNCFKYLFIILLLFVSINNLTFAATSLTEEEKDVFNLAGNFGETSFILSDILANKEIMGIVILNQKIERLIKGVSVQPALAENLKLSKKTRELMRKFIKEVEDSYKEEVLNKKKLMTAKETFALLTKNLEQELNKQYGSKYVWLFNTGFLVYFTKTSMQSEYKEKLVLLDFGYLLDYIPYDLPTSVIASLSDIVTTRDLNMTQLQADLLKEASENIAYYFNDPLTYTPPATLKDFVGEWEGRLSSPNGTNHKASLLVKPDMTGILNVKGMFKDMPVNSISVTQSLISFNIKPYGEDKLVIKFSGRIVDDVISGEAVDVSGKKGLWQFLKVSKQTLNNVVSPDVKNDPAYLDRLIGVWKGKVLEENGAISNLTLHFNLVGDSVMTVANKNKEQSLKLNSVAVNDKAVKFDVSSETNKGMDITFIGNFKGRVLEGSANASDGSRGYWKLIKVSDKPDNKRLNFNYNLDKLCDPVIEVVNEAYNVILATNEAIIIPASKLREGKYKGYLEFPDGIKADLIFILSNKKLKMQLISKEDKSKLDLNVKNLKITDREITFDTLTSSDQSTKVRFKGKIFGDYIYGTAKNAAGEQLRWELVAVKKTDKLLAGVRASDPSRIKGYWEGVADFAGVFQQSVIVSIDDSGNKMIIGDKKSLNLSQIILDGSMISFVISDYPNLTFNGLLEGETITGKIISIDGLGLNVKLSRVQACVESPLTGIWKGSITSGNANADIVFDFAEDVKKIFIDDAKAASGRLELIVSDLSLDSKKVQFKAKTPKNPVFINFNGKLFKENIKGTAQNQVDGSKKLSWSVSKLKLEKYTPDNNITSNSKPKYQKTFSFLDEINEKKDKHLKVNNNNSKDNKQDDKALKKSDNKISKYKKDSKLAKNEIDKPEESPSKLVKDSKESSKASSDTKKKRSSKKKNKKKKKVSKKDKKSSKKPLKSKHKKTKETKLSDSEMFKSSEIARAQKQMVQMNKQKADKKKDSKKSNQKKSSNKTQKNKKVQKNTLDTTKNNNTVKETKVVEKKENKEVIDQKEKCNLENSGNKSKEREVNSKSISVKESKQSIIPKNFIGKWVGEMVSPQNDRGEIILEIKDKESYMYVDKEGEKVPFKLFEFCINGKNIGFKIKPSPDADYGITFKGALIQGVLSGEAIDPTGKKGKWHARNLKSLEKNINDNKKKVKQKEK